MVQAPTDTGIRLPWDAFVDREIDKLSSDGERRLDMAKSTRQHLDAWRELDWPNIKIELRKPPYQWEIPDDLEPHWIAPGKAVWWQKQTVRTRVEKTGDNGRTYRILEDVEHGWQPTNAGLPTNNPSQIAAYLEKGLRLRPPLDGVDDETLRSSVPSEALQAAYAVELEPEEQVEYVDQRIGYKKRTFHSWKSYVRFCSANKLPLEHSVPAEVMEKAQGYRWYCFQCDVGFNNQRHAERHYQVERRRPTASSHETVAQMRMVPAKDTTENIGG